MDKEEVKKILKEVYWEEFDYSQPEQREASKKWFDAKAQQIYQLFEQEIQILKHEWGKLVTEAHGRGYKLAERECQQKIEEIFREIERLWQDCEFICHIPLKDYKALRDGSKKEKK